MTNADYLAIAVSPALVMALVGSLVFFLIEVLYVGDYVLRLNYVFALFVFATVLIARIAIEFGSERAAMFSLPLGILTFLALMRFVEHNHPLSPIINLALLAVVWWSAHKLTWDCTLIDDNEDASGEGLLGRVGLDGSDAAPADNELLAGRPAIGEPVSFWRRLLQLKNGPHTPGIWVLYFSIAALPLFGILQRWIPPGDVGRRRYAFGLLAAYVAAALSLLVTTSFLGLRRYLRQRHVEMPAPMAATWVALGGVLILLVMFTAALIPRPKAEYAISQVPWQSGSRGELHASRYSVGREGIVNPEAENQVVSDQEDAPLGEATGSEQDSPPAAEGQGDESAASGAEQEGEQPSPGNDSARSRTETGDAANSDSAQTPTKQDENNKDANSQPAEQGGSEDNPQSADADEQSASSDSNDSKPTNSIENYQSATLAQLQGLSASLGDGLKIAFYVLLALVIGYLAWRNREAVAWGVADFWRAVGTFLASLFGGRRATSGDGEPDEALSTARRSTFADFSDPFLGGRAAKLAPVELVRYTFEAFEAWAGDRGRPRTPDQTPQELVRSALPPQTPMYAEARQMAQLYSEAAYASTTLSRDAAARLQSLWQMMRTHSPPRRPSHSAEPGASS
jgi:hypothetical protein